LSVASLGNLGIKQNFASLDFFVSFFGNEKKKRDIVHL
jgi:hypothetical protein